MVGDGCFGCCQANQVSIAPVFSLIYCWVLIFTLSHFYILIYMFLEMMMIFAIFLTLIRLRSFMQTKHLLVLIHIWNKREVGTPWSRVKPSSYIFLLTFPRWCFFYGSFMLFLSCFCYAFVYVCKLMPCGHLLGKDWPLGFSSWCLIVKLSLSHWYPVSGVVLNCINSWSLPFFLLW